MNINYNYIKQVLDISQISFEDFVQKLSIGGLEVDDYSFLAQGSSLVIGKTLEVINHPDSDHLHLCKVDIGDKILDIICGAPNVKAGQKVIVALVGAYLPAKKLTIKETIIRGYPSAGMLCSYSELGVDQKYVTQDISSGIAILAKNAPVGKEALSYLGLDDIILNIKSYPNRPDELSINGLIEEIAAILNVKHKKINKIKPLSSTTQFTDFTFDFDENLVKNFVLIKIDGIKVAESPAFIKDSLHKWGYQSVNNIVDLGNYVMHLTGQPFHIYDAAKMGNGLSIHLAKNTNFHALNDKTYQLENDILIKDNQNKDLCLAGIMGAKNVMVSENTTSIYLEAAIFSSKYIKNTSNRLGLASDSSTRFIKGVNEYLLLDSLAILVDLIEKIINPKLITAPLVYKEIVYKKTVLKLSISKFNLFVGGNFSRKEIEKTLKQLSFGVKASTKDCLEVTIPSYRQDITIIQDLYEELIRILGYDTLPCTLPAFIPSSVSLTTRQILIAKIRSYLSSLGLNETLSYTLTTQKENEVIDPTLDNAILLTNPLTTDHSVLRESLLPSLVTVAKYNLSRQKNNYSFFEISEIYTKKSYTTVLSILVSKTVPLSYLDKQERDFSYIKGLVEGILSSLSVEKYQLQLASHPQFQPKQSATILFRGKPIGTFGKINSKLYEEEAYGLELTLDEIFTYYDESLTYTAPLIYPVSKRDLSIVFPVNTNYAKILSTIKGAGGELLKSITLFDKYDFEDKISLAFHLEFAALDHTLKDSEVEILINKITSDLLIKNQGKLR